MPKAKTTPKKLSMSNTKKEMLEAYNALLEQLQERADTSLTPERKAEEEKVKEIEELTDSLSSEKIARETSNLKIEIGKMLGELSERLENAVNKFKDIQRAIKFKERELKEVYEIEKSAGTLLALVEAQNQKRREFEEEMERLRAEWEREKKEEAKKREREKEEYLYRFKREQQLAKDKFEDEKAVKETTERLQQEAKTREELLKKEFDGERNVLTTRIKSLEETVKQQNEQIIRLSQQLEKAYQKIQDIAVKTVEGKSISAIQGILNEQVKKNG